MCVCTELYVFCVQEQYVFVYRAAYVCAQEQYVFVYTVVPYST